MSEDEREIERDATLPGPRAPDTKLLMAKGSGVALDDTYAAGSLPALDASREASVSSTRSSARLASRLRYVAFAAAVLAAVNIVYFVARFIVADDAPLLHPDFRATSAPGAFESMAVLDGPLVSLIRITVVSTLFLVISLWVAQRNKREPIVQLLGALGVLGGQYSLSVAVLTSTETLVGPRAIATVVYVLMPLGGFAMLALFPSGKSVPRWAIRTLPLTVIPFVLQAVEMLRHRAYSVPLAGVYFALALVYLACQWHRYRDHATLRERHQIKWVTYAAAGFIGLQLVAVVGLIPLLRDHTRTGYPLIKLLFEVTLAASYLVGLASVMFGAARYRLWDVDRVINRTVVYVLVTLVLGSVFAIGYFALHALLRGVLAASAWIVAVVALVIVVALFAPTRRRIARWIDRRFYGIGLDYEGLAAKAVGAARGALPAATTAFASYDELELLGRGGMGAVYRAHHASFDVPIALKVMSPELADDADAQARFRREAQILEGLPHPNVVPFLASGHERGLAFIAMQYVEGQDLGAVLRRAGRFTLNEVASVVDGVAAALDDAHEKGVIHRDLKPSNILLEGAPTDPIARRRPLVMDFGVAKVSGDFDAPAVEGALVGSLPYIAPEQIENADAIDGRADLYALACTVYELLTGRPPFHESTPLGLVMAHKRQPPPDPRTHVPSLPAAAAHAILRALAKSPADRQPTLAAFAAELRAA